MTAPSRITLRKVTAMEKERHRSVCGERKAREKNQRIQSILDAARNLIAAKGYLKSTMDEIAMAVGITKPAIYFYFKTKDDLLLALVQPFIDDIQSRLEVLGAKLLSGKVRDGDILIAAIVRIIFRGHESTPEAFRLVRLFQQQMLFGKANQKIRRDLQARVRIGFQLVQSLLAKGMEMGLIRNGNVVVMADLIWGVTIGVIQLEESKADPQKSRRLIRDTLDMASCLMAGKRTDDGKTNQNHENEK